MLLIGLKTENTGIGTYDTDLASVSHQRMDIIAGSPVDTMEKLSELYNKMVEKGKESQKKLIKLQDELEYSNMSEKEYERKVNSFLSDIKILRYNQILIIEGVVLK